MSGLLVIPGVHNSNHRNPYDSGWKHPKKTWKNLKKTLCAACSFIRSRGGQTTIFLRGDSYRICTSTSVKFSTVKLGDGFTWCFLSYNLLPQGSLFWFLKHRRLLAAHKHGRSKQKIECFIFMLPFHRSSKYCPVRIVQNTLRASLKKKSKEHEKRKCTCIDTETLVPTPSNFVEAEVKS